MTQVFIKYKNQYYVVSVQRSHVFGKSSEIQISTSTLHGYIRTLTHVRTINHLWQIKIVFAKHSIAIQIYRNSFVIQVELSQTVLCMLYTKQTRAGGEAITLTTVKTSVRTIRIQKLHPPPKKNTRHQPPRAPYSRVESANQSTTSSGESHFHPLTIELLAVRIAEARSQIIQ